MQTRCTQRHCVHLPACPPICMRQSMVSKLLRQSAIWYEGHLRSSLSREVVVSPILCVSGFSGGTPPEAVNKVCAV